MEQHLIQQAAQRVGQMERCFDDLQEAASKDPTSLVQDAALNALLQNLIRYYESGQWLRDYELDEQHLLPPELKRGVLAQDAVYNFLDRVMHMDG